jgi:hypothetical protein
MPPASLVANAGPWLQGRSHTQQRRIIKGTPLSPAIHPAPQTHSCTLAGRSAAPARRTAAPTLPRGHASHASCSPAQPSPARPLPAPLQAAAGAGLADGARHRVVGVGAHLVGEALLVAAKAGEPVVEVAAEGARLRRAQGEARSASAAARRQAPSEARQAGVAPPWPAAAGAAASPALAAALWRRSGGAVPCAQAAHRLEELVLALEVEADEGEAVEALDLGRGGKHARVLVRAVKRHVDGGGAAAGGGARERAGEGGACRLGAVPAASQASQGGAEQRGYAAPGGLTSQSWRSCKSAGGPSEAWGRCCCRHLCCCW